jgi:Transmembrane secretion effector
MIGPAAGGAIIAVFGVGLCFVINAASFVGPLIALTAMDATKLYRADMRTPRSPGAVRAGLRYVRSRRDLFIPLGMMAIIGTLAYEFQVSIPLMAHSGFHLGATGFGLLYAAMGAGAVLSGITLAGKVPGHVRTLTIAAAAFGIALTAAAAAPSPVTEGICLAFVGAASVVFSSSTNAMLQIRADPSMRGRVVALYIMAFMGSTAIGGPPGGRRRRAAGPAGVAGSGGRRLRRRRAARARFGQWGTDQGGRSPPCERARRGPSERHVAIDRSAETRQPPRGPEKGNADCVSSTAVHGRIRARRASCAPVPNRAARARGRSTAAFRTRPAPGARGRPGSVRRAARGSDGSSSCPPRR